MTTREMFRKKLREAGELDDTVIELDVSLTPSNPMGGMFEICRDSPVETWA